MERPSDLRILYCCVVVTIEIKLITIVIGNEFNKNPKNNRLPFCIMVYIRYFGDMTVMKTCLIVWVLVRAFSCGAAEDAAKSTDQENIQGVWLAQSESQNGIQKEVTYQYVFTKDKVTFTDETGKVVKYSYKLDTTGKPRLLIIRPEPPLADSAPVSVGYALDKDSLKIVVAPEGLRPTDISDRNNQELILCKRKGS